MTNFEAVKAEVAPYAADKIKIEKSLIDAGISAVETYAVTNKAVIGEISINILKSYLSLSSESEGGFSQSFDTSGLKAKIEAIAKENGLTVDVSSNVIVDKSNYW